jgi:hypothetical protein
MSIRIICVKIYYHKNVFSPCLTVGVDITVTEIYHYVMQSKTLLVYFSLTSGSLIIFKYDERKQVKYIESQTGNKNENWIKKKEEKKKKRKKKTTTKL